MAPPIRAASIPPIAQARRAAVQRIFDGRSLVLAVDTNVLVYAADADSQFHAAKVPSAQSAASAPVDPPPPSAGDVCDDNCRLGLVGTPPVGQVSVTADGTDSADAKWAHRRFRIYWRRSRDAFAI
jgi:hypothetical protein